MPPETRAPPSYLYECMLLNIETSNSAATLNLPLDVNLHVRTILEIVANTFGSGSLVSSMYETILARVVERILWLILAFLAAVIRRLFKRAAVRVLAWRRDEYPCGYSKYA